MTDANPPDESRDFLDAPAHISEAATTATGGMVEVMRRYHTDPVFQAKVHVGALALLAEGPPDLEWDGARFLVLVVLTAVANAEETP